MNDNYVLEDLLVQNFKIFQDKSQYSFTSDATILAQFIDVKPNDRIVEACSGSGIISILLAVKGASNITCFEIQETMAKMSQASIEYNNLTDKIKIICDDFQNAKNYVKPCDVVVCNPPYYNSGLQSENSVVKKAKFETTMNLEQLIQTSANLLNDKGVFYICFAPERTSELLYKLTKHNLQPKTMFFTQKDKTKKPSCVFVRAIKNGKFGIDVLPTLFTHNDNGEFVLTCQELFENYKNTIKK